MVQDIVIEPLHDAFLLVEISQDDQSTANRITHKGRQHKIQKADLIYNFLRCIIIVVILRIMPTFQNTV